MFSGLFGTGRLLLIGWRSAVGGHSTTASERRLPDLGLRASQHPLKKVATATVTGCPAGAWRRVEPLLTGLQPSPWSAAFGTKCNTIRSWTTAARAIARACAMGYNFKEIQRFPSKWPIQPCAGTVAGLRPTSGRITFWLKSAVRSAAGASLPAPRSSGRRTGRRGSVAVVCRPWRESARGRGGRGRPASCATSNGGTAVECKLGGRGVGSAAGSTCGRQRSSRWRSSSWRPARTSERAATGDVEPRGLPHAEEKRPEPSLRGGGARPRREIRRPTDFNTRSVSTRKAP